MRRRIGFAMMALLIIVLVLAILASIAITKFGDAERRAYLTAMQSDLRGLATVPESRYTSDHSYEHVEAPQGSDGVTLTFAGSTSGWSATATHLRVPGVACSIAAGTSRATNASREPVFR